MKIVLVNMPWKCNGLWGIRAGSRWPHIKHPYGEKDYLPYPFFLGYATSLLRKNGFDVELIDAIAERIEISEFIKILENKNPDLIVAETSTPSLNYDLSLLKEIREIAPVALCGPEYNIRRLSFLKDKPFIDYVLVGEYEQTLLELVRQLERKKELSQVKGLIFRKNNRIYKNPLRALISDLDSLPWPYREDLVMENYIDAPGGMPLPCAQMWSSRGCPYKCIFCLWPQIMYQGNTYRIRNPYQVVNEMEFLIRELKFKSIYIDDDTTNVNKNFLIQVSKEIKRRGLRFPWAIMARPDLMDPELLKVLRSAGLYAVKYGVESASQKLLDNANKKMNLQKAIEMIKLTHKLGIKTHLTFTFGLPGETRQTIRKTIDLALELNPYSIQFSITTPFPGTKYFQQLKKLGWREPDDWSLFDGHKAAVVSLEGVRPDELEKALEEAYSSWFRHRNQSLLKKTILQEAKAFWDCSRLYGVRLAMEKSKTYLTIKNQLKTECRYKEERPKQSKDEILKGILNGRNAYRGPKIAVLDLTNKCNLSCIGCWLYSPHLDKESREKLQRKEQLEFSTIKNLIDEFHKLDVEEIQISGGGEPLLHPEIFQVLKHIKSKNIPVQLVTNFTLLDKKKIDEMLKIGVDYLTLSLWAGDAETYLKVHPGASKKLFRRIEENINYLIERRINDKPLLKIYNVISKENYKNIPQMLDFALKVKADYLEFQLMDPIPGKTEHLMIGREEALEIKQVLREFKERADYVSDFISDEDLLIFDLPEHKKELSDFGRFIKRYNQEFQLINGLRMAKCPQGYYSIRREVYPVKDVRHIKYFFDPQKCKECKLSKKCLQESPDAHFQIDLLTILGIETFLRRVDSIWQGKAFLDGKFLDSLPCYAGWTFTRITTKGDVKPCCKAENLIMGNIEQKKFSEIWSSFNYDQFREKALRLPKSDSFFKEINCYKVCDNLGMNLVTHRMILRETKRPISNSTSILYQDNRVVIPATNFLQGNLNNQGSIFGKNLVVDSGAGFGYAKYKFKISKPGFYQLWSRYAAEIPRPVELRIDGNYISRICKLTTGGWTSKHLKYFKEHEIYLQEGKHSIELFSPSYFPHLERLELRFVSSARKEALYSDPSVSYRKRVPFKLFWESLQTHGPKFTLARTVRYLKENLFKNYLEIIGILDGETGYKGPFHVQIDLINQCNNNCIGCWCNSPLLEEKAMPPQIKQQYLPFEIIRETLQEVKKMGALEVYYSGGGEPFMHPEIMKILRYTKSLGLTCYVNTNFTLLNREKIDQIIEIGIDHLTVSIWAGTPSTYARTHPNKTEATFYQIKENLSYLNRRKNEKPYIKLYEVIFNLNYHEVKEMIELAQATSSESVEFTLIDTIPGKTDRLALTPQERDKLYQLCLEIERELEPNFNYKGIHLFRFDQFMRRIKNQKDVAEAKYDKNIIDSIPCYIGWLFTRILPDGNVNSCLKSHRFPVGNIFEESFSKIWNSPPQIYFRKKTLCYKKEDKFFRLIGNDPQTKEAGCYRSCDDIGRNLHMHKKIMSLTFLEYKLLKLITSYLKYRRKKNKLISPVTKTLPILRDKVVQGIVDGRKAYQGPEHVVIDLTNKCQLNCIACWLYSPYLEQNRPSAQWLRQEIPFSRAKSLIEELSESGTKIIRFTGGGEPFLYKGLLELMSLVKEKGIRLCLTTNLFNLEESVIKELLKIKPDEIAVSLWAGDAESYLQMHPGSREEEFARIRENLKLFNSEKKNTTKVTLANVIMNRNYKNIFQMAKFAGEVKADAVYFTLVDVFPGETDFLLLKDSEYMELKQLFKKARNYLEDLGIEIENLNGFEARIDSRSSTGEYDQKRIDKIPCYVGWFFCRILADGSIVPCCRGVNYPLGNINLTSFKEIWFSSRYNGFRSRARYLKKDHPYFWKMNCYKECDNFMHNQDIHKRVLLTTLK